MTQHWMLETHGDPIGAIRRLLQEVWRSAHLEGLLAAAGASDSGELRLLQHPEMVAEVNPFRPVMPLSAARALPAALAARRRARLGVLVRPCEMRALLEMVRLEGIALDDVVTVCVDCLATLPVAEYRREADRRVADDRLAAEALRFARQGGISPYRYRPACQTCVSPAASGADVNIGVLGLPAREFILVHAGERASAARLPLSRWCDGEAPPEAVAARAALLARSAERRGRARARIVAGLGDRVPADVEAVAAMLDRCRDCGACFAACPICGIHPICIEADGTHRRADVAEVLGSCVGCGMCEQACPEHYPLTTFFGSVRDHMTDPGD